MWWFSHCLFLVRSHLDYITDAIAQVDSAIDAMVAEFENTISLLRTIAVFQMMTTGDVWNPSDLFKVDMPDSLKERQLSKAVKQATKFLKKQGLTVS